MPLSSGRFAPATLAKLEPSVHTAIKESLGFSESTLFEAAIQCVQQGKDQQQIKGN